MELGQLLNAIIEVSHAVAKIPCAPNDKNEVLDKIKDLFSSYTAISNAFAHAARSSEASNPRQEQTIVNDCCALSEGNPKQDRMQEKIQNMDEKLHTMAVKLEQLERQQEHLGGGESTSNLKSEFAVQTESLRVMKEMQESVFDRVTFIENKSNELEVIQNRIKEISAFVDGESSFQIDLLKMHTEIASFEGLVEEKIQGSKECVAFSATAASIPRKYRPEDVILFHDVEVNLHDCYDPHIGTFRTKVLGLYMFSTSINTNSRGDFEAAIVHNGKEVALFGTPGHKDLQTGTSTVLQLTPGDTVYVKVRSESDTQTGVEIGGGFSNFIGFKIG